MKNEGLLKRLLLNYWPPRIPSVQTSWVRVTLADISPILYMFGMGVILGVLLLGAEKAHSQFSKNNGNAKGGNGPKSRFFWNNIKNMGNLVTTPFKSNWEVQTGNYTKWDNDAAGKWQDDGYWEKNLTNEIYRDEWTK